LVLRSRDTRYWQGNADAKTLGIAVIEALDPKRSQHQLTWLPECAEYTRLSEERMTVVVWRHDHKMIIATPFCSWGKAPNIELSELPQLIDLGNAVIFQAKYSSDAKSKSTQS
jgi:hypothetical protein